MTLSVRRIALPVAASIAMFACSSSDGATPDRTTPGTATPDSVASDAAAPDAASPAAGAPSFVATISAAIAAVEAELGGPQEFFEVTANTRFTNVFVAVDDATAAVGYLFVDGELAPAGPKQQGASGKTFTAVDVDFDPGLVLSGVSTDLPTSTIDALSVYGTGISAVYVVGVTSESGGFLDIEVGPTGQVFSVDPV